MRVSYQMKGFFKVLDRGRRIAVCRFRYGKLMECIRLEQGALPCVFASELSGATCGLYGLTRLIRPT